MQCANKASYIQQCPDANCTANAAPKTVSFFEPVGQSSPVSLFEFEAEWHGRLRRCFALVSVDVYNCIT